MNEIIVSNKEENDFMPNMVYMMTNMGVMNQVVAFYRNVNGTLTFAGALPTRGSGSGIKGINPTAAA
ncbi:hypothetical protein ACFO9Q_10900 [Paenibacillus sp. GCM10023252]|uniref:hypothetical protein n=1 Tax=Paenibacillus sp. GCM10023252 TaxID=3252649 RepID=UPI00360BEBA0